jgi:error-prone DNA polymerase
MPSPTIRSVADSPLGYAELDVKTNFSFLRGASHADELVYRAAELGYRAIAVTDFNSLAGIVRMHQAAKEVKLKLLIGTRLVFSDAPELLVWAPNRASYAALCRLLTLGKRRTHKGECELRLADFLADSAGLLAAVVMYGIPFDHPAKRQAAKNAARDSSPLAAWRGTSAPYCFTALRDALGPRLSLAISCAYGTDDSTTLRDALALSRTYDIPLLATNDVHYHEPSRRRLQDVLTCVRHGCTIQQAGFKLFPNAERYLKSPAQMHRLFADYPQAIHRGLEIAEQCDFSLDSLRYEYPDELVPPGKTTIEYLTELTWAGAARRYPGGILDKVRHQIAHELRLIEQLKFEAYFLTVYDLVRFARSRDILCQGRGSAANSAVCYCIGVTSVDPAQIDLLFERFISAARNEPPDIDVDFEHERREEVIQYVYEKYGRDRAGMTATVITYRGRSAIRDVGKAMGLSLDMVDSMASKLDWWDRGVLDEDRIRQCGLDPADKTIRRVIALASELLGFPRHLSQHVGGLVMTRGLLCEMVPIENASMEDRTVIEWDKDDIDALGLLKVDVLALGMLTCISKAFKMLNCRGTRPCAPTTPHCSGGRPSRLSHDVGCGHGRRLPN